MNVVRLFVISAVIVLFPASGFAGNAADTIPAGTKITMQNWRHYRQFMPEGMVDLFEGRYFWKMPPSVEMDVGPTVIHPLPKGYVEATRKYASQVKIVKLPDGGLNVANYVAGQPFPNPSEPHKGWKILADVWYRYLPHLIVDGYGTGCTQDRLSSINCTGDMFVYRQLAHNTDPGVPATIPGTKGKFFTEWTMILEPEQLKYTADLTIAYTDLTKAEDVFVFKPELRRYQPVSSLARCIPSGGTDGTRDDFRFGFNGQPPTFQAKFLGEKKILAMLDYPATAFPADYDMPLGWPKPSWGKWQLRDVYVIEVRKIPSEAAGYCYGRRVMYVDKQFDAPLWEDLYDSKMNLWKFFAIFPRVLNVPGVGPENVTGSQVEAFWDIQNDHSTFFSDPKKGRAFYINQEAPKEYNDLAKYTTPGGLNEIMR
jgi:Protein of unknown function (DUF1329)